MIARSFIKTALAAILLFVVSGCGDSNSNTNGVLSLTVNAPSNAGVVNVTATATLTPAKVGTDVNFVARVYGVNPVTGLIETTEVTPSAGTMPTDASNSAVWVANFANPTIDTTLEVTASSAGLYKTVRVPIPKL